MNEYELSRTINSKPPKPNLFDLIREGEPFHITLMGRPVAVCLPVDEYDRLCRIASGHSGANPDAPSVRLGAVDSQ